MKLHYCACGEFHQDANEKKNRFRMTFVPHDKMPAMTSENTPLKVEYCSLCGLPHEYCSYGPLWDKHPKKDAESVQTEGAKAEEKPLSIKAPKIASSSSTITVKIAPRIGRRYLTTIAGLDDCDVDLAKACKIFAKKFACGVSKNDVGEIEIQGDCEESIVDVLTSNWKQIKAKNVVIKRK